MIVRLGVNIDHVATLRNARRGIEPEVVYAAGEAEKGGADQITVHLREDRRHIKDRDVKLLKQAITSRLNLEMSTDKEIVEIALQIEPHQVTLVPERREEITTEGGLDVIKYFEKLKDVILEFHKKNIAVSLFIDPNLKQVEKSKEAGADIIEIHTGHYSNLFREGKFFEELKKIEESAKLADSIGLTVAAGHGLNYFNTFYVAAIPEIIELNIGHSIISKAIFVGLATAVKEMKEIMYKAKLLYKDFKGSVVDDIQRRY